MQTRLMTSTLSVPGTQLDAHQGISTVEVLAT